MSEERQAWSVLKDSVKRLESELASWQRQAAQWNASCLEARESIEEMHEWIEAMPDCAFEALSEVNDSETCLWLGRQPFGDGCLQEIFLNVSANVEESCKRIDAQEVKVTVDGVEVKPEQQDASELHPGWRHIEDQSHASCRAKAQRDGELIAGLHARTLQQADKIVSLNRKIAEERRKKKAIKAELKDLKDQTYSLIQWAAGLAGISDSEMTSKHTTLKAVANAAAQAMCRHHGMVAEEQRKRHDNLVSEYSRTIHESHLTEENQVSILAAATGGDAQDHLTHLCERAAEDLASLQAEVDSLTREHNAISSTVDSALDDLCVGIPSGEGEPKSLLYRLTTLLDVYEERKKPGMGEELSTAEQKRITSMQDEIDALKQERMTVMSIVHTFWHKGINGHGLDKALPDRLKMVLESYRKSVPSQGEGASHAPNVSGLSEAQRDIASQCDAIKAILLEKNARYGNSALEPVRVFSQASASEQILVRLDDKISRLSRGAGLLYSGDGEDCVMDLIGYLVLLKISLSKEVTP